jgi:hypothetical protein
MNAHRFPSILRRVSATLAALTLAQTPALAGWSADPVQVFKSAGSVPLLKACSDGAHGTFVAWQENAPTGQRLLRAQHLLEPGDFDPAWSDTGVLVCAVDAPRTNLFALSDHLGGAYLLWSESGTLYAKRIGSDGATAAGWPARGREIGTTGVPPSVIEDGGTGFYAAWVTAFGALSAIHLGPTNTGAGGWPNSSRGIGPATNQPSNVLWPRLALAPDGGLFVAYAYWSPDAEPYAGAYRLRRLTSAGLAASGWGVGFDFGTIYRAELGAANSGLVAVSPDGRGGAFLFVGVMGDPASPEAPLPTDLRMFRRMGDGSTASDWPDAGISIPSYGVASVYVDAGVGGSVSVLPNASDGAFFGQLESYADAGSFLDFAEISSSGQRTYDHAVSATPYYGVDILPVEGGGLYVASFKPNGPTSLWDSAAFIGVERGPETNGFGGWSESHDDPVAHWYDGVALASTGDGGIVFFWAQSHERYGVFARKFAPGGEVTGVDPVVRASLALDPLRFLRGSGVRVSLSIREAGPVGIGLYDVAGRRVASETLAGLRGMNEVTIPGTAMLSPGLYFARVSTRAGARVGRVVVTR